MLSKSVLCELSSGTRRLELSGTVDVSSAISVTTLCLVLLLSPFSHNDFVAILDLPEGEHQYKFFVDGQWVHDPSEVTLSCFLSPETK